MRVRAYWNWNIWVWDISWSKWSRTLMIDIGPFALDVSFGS